MTDLTKKQKLARRELVLERITEAQTQIHAWTVALSALMVLEDPVLAEGFENLAMKAATLPNMTRAQFLEYRDGYHQVVLDELNCIVSGDV